MTARNARTFIHFAAAATLLTGALAAQHADVREPREERDRAAAGAAQATPARQRLAADDDLLTLDAKHTPRTAPVIGQAQRPGNKPLTQPPARRDAMLLQVEADADAVRISLQRKDDQPWIGAILASLDGQLVDAAPALPPLLGPSAALAVAMINPDSLCRVVLAKVARPGDRVSGFYVQGVAVSLRGADATEVRGVSFRGPRRG